MNKTELRHYIVEQRRAVVREAIAAMNPVFGAKKIDNGYFLTITFKQYVIVFSDYPIENASAAKKAGKRALANKNIIKPTEALLYVWKRVQDGDLPVIEGDNITIEISVEDVNK